MSKTKLATYTGLTKWGYTWEVLGLLFGSILMVWAAGHLGQMNGLEGIEVVNHFGFNRRYVALSAFFILGAAFLNVREAYSCGIRVSWKEYIDALKTGLAATAVISGAVLTLAQASFDAVPRIFLKYLPIMAFADALVFLSYKANVPITQQVGELQNEGILTKIMKRGIYILLYGTIISIVSIDFFYTKDGLGVDVNRAIAIYDTLVQDWRITIWIPAFSILVIWLFVKFASNQRLDAVINLLPGILAGGTFLRIVVVYIELFLFNTPLNLMTVVAIFAQGALFACYSPSRFERRVTTNKDSKG